MVVYVDVGQRLLGVLPQVDVLGGLDLQANQGFIVDSLYCDSLARLSRAGSCRDVCLNETSRFRPVRY